MLDPCPTCDLKRVEAERPPRSAAVYLRSDYELVEFYDLRTANICEDLGFLASYVAARGDGVAEIGCGSGRILAALARAGVSRLHGIDASPEMLERARTRLPDHVALHQLDAGARWSDEVCRSIGRHSNVIIAFNSFHEIGPVKRRVRCLRNCRRIMKDDGELLIDVRFPDFFRNGKQQVQDRKISEFTTPRGEYVECWINLCANFVMQTIRGCSRYHVYDKEGGEMVATYHSPIQSWLTKPSEFRLLAAASGLRVKAMWGDYDRSPYRAAVSQRCVVTFCRSN